ncbi:MAG: HAD hydrolase family protein [Candidatus Nanoarchaeia archaeon]
MKSVKDKNIKGFEPKEFIITIHCKSRVKKIESIMSKQKGLYAIWNDEAYDIGIKKIQTKAVGLKAFMKILKLKKKNVLAVGDNYSDKPLFDAAGLTVTADKARVSGNYFVKLDKKNLPAAQLMTRMIKIV